MRKIIAVILIVSFALAFFYACINPVAGSTPDTEEVKTALATAASEAARFVFLPPLVEDRGIDEGFDPSFSPVVRIDELGDDPSSDFPLEFTMASANASEQVQVDPEEKHYSVNWNTGEYSVRADRNYRITVEVNGVEIGHIDVDPVDNGSNLKDVDFTHYVGVVVGATLPIIFRIEPVAGGNPWSVTTLNNDGAGSLRDLIENSSYEVIDFDPLILPGTIALEGTLLISRDVAIEGPGLEFLSISGENAWMVVRVLKGVTVAISGVTVTEGKDGSGNSDQPGGIINYGTLTVENCAITDNVGCGISNLNSGSLTVRHCVISGNSASYGLGSAISNSNSTTAVVDTVVSENSGAIGAIANDFGMLTVENCTVSDNTGIGIYSNRIKLTVTDSVISGNNSPSPPGCGIVGIDGEIEIENCTISDNTGVLGGGINNCGLMTVTSSMISGNIGSNGGGVWNGATNGATMTIEDCTLSGNSAYQEGGCVYNVGELSVENSILSGNSAAVGGGVFNGGTVSIEGSSISGNSATDKGGGIYKNDAGLLVVTTSALSGNSAHDGAGMFLSDGSVSIKRSTISGNTAANLGGGIFKTGTCLDVDIVNSTISGNFAGSSGGGFFNEFGTATVQSSTFAGNTTDDTDLGGAICNLTTAIVKNCIFVIGTAGGNYYGDPSGLTVLGDNLSNDDTMPGIPHTATKLIKLSGLADNGGPTLTHALLSGSVAIDGVGDNILVNGTTTVGQDQRGVTRPRGSAADIGAFEF